MVATTDPPATGRSRPGRGGLGTVVGAVVVGLALLQALWITTVPPFRGSDEVDHAYRADAVAHGQWVVTEAAPEGRGGLVEVRSSLVEAAHEQCAALSYMGEDNCSPVTTTPQGRSVVASAATGYNPLFYWVVGSAARSFDGSAALYAMRAATGLLSLVFAAIAAGALWRASRSGWPMVAIALAVPPVLLFSTSVVAPNGVEMAAALALWSCLLALDDRGARTTNLWLIAAAVAAASVLATLRTLGPLFVLLAVGLVALLKGAGGVRLVRRHPVVLLGGAVAVGSATVAAVWWSLASGLVSGEGGAAAGWPDGTWPLGTLVLWPLQTIAAFPYRDIPGPVFVYPLVVALVAFVTVRALRAGTALDRTALAAAVVAALALPVVLTALTRDTLGVMWQGRYGLPLGVGFVLMAGHVLDRAVRRHRTGPPSTGVLATTGAALVVVTVACLHKVAADERLRDASVGDPSWHPPGLWVLLVVSVVAWSLVLGVGAAVGRRAR